MATQMVPQRVDGKAFEERRLRLGLSRERLGAAAGGVASQTVVRIERGLVNPHPRTVGALVAALEAEESRVAENFSGTRAPVEEVRPGARPG